MPTISPYKCTDCGYKIHSGCYGTLTERFTDNLIVWREFFSGFLSRRNYQIAHEREGEREREKECAQRSMNRMAKSVEIEELPIV